MGRQVTVNLIDLLNAGCTLVPTLREYVDEDTGAKVDTSYLSVILPGKEGGIISSYCMDCLCFDCRSITTSNNAWAEEWLIANKVTYSEG